MCYAPTRKAIDFASKAKERIREGNIPAAERLLDFAKLHGQSVMNVRWTDDKRVGDHVAEATEMLLQAKRLVASR